MCKIKLGRVWILHTPRNPPITKSFYNIRQTAMLFFLFGKYEVWIIVNNVLLCMESFYFVSQYHFLAWSWHINQDENWY